VNVAVVCTMCFYMDVVDMETFGRLLCPQCDCAGLARFEQQEGDNLLRIGDEKPEEK